MPRWHLMTSTTTDLWSEPVTRRIFGIVPDEAVRRHPSELWRIGTSAVIVAVTAVMALHVSKFEKVCYDADRRHPRRPARRLLGAVPRRHGRRAHRPDGGGARGPPPALRARSSSRPASSPSASAALLQAAVGSAAIREAAGLDDPQTPIYPVVLLAVSTAVILVASSYLTRTARHLVVALLIVACCSAALLTLGLSADVIGALALGWGVAAAVRLAVGSPAGTPSVAEVASALTELGVRARDLDLTPEQVWGEVRYTAVEETCRTATSSARSPSS